MTLLALLACLAPEPDSVAAPLPPGALPESDLPFQGTGRWELGGHVLTLADTTLSLDGAPVLRHVYDDPVAGPDVLWVPADPGGGDGGIYAVTVPDGLVITPLLTEGRPDRLALAPDGATLVYVAGTTGITSVWSIPTVGGAPRQLTNVGVTRPGVPGTPPIGFVPPPERVAPRFVGERLVWSARGADWEAAWR